MSTFARDSGFDTLLDLDGVVLAVDEMGHWVKFVVHRTDVSPERPRGLGYSLTLHAPNGDRLVGFDNAHPVKTRRGLRSQQRPEYDHKHRLRSVGAYDYRDAATLLADFWSEVEIVLQEKDTVP